MLTLFLLLVILIFILWIIWLKIELRKKTQIEKNLREQENHFRTLFDIAPIFIDSFDTNGKCLLWNKECERVFGWNIEEINAHENAFELFHPDPKQQEIMREAFASRKDTQYIEMNPLSKNGKKIPSRWVNVNASNGQIVYIGIDLREQKEAEKMLLDTQQELQELNLTLQERVENGIKEIQKKEQMILSQSRFALMGEMLSMIAHQWRQPLSVIGMSALNIQNKINLKKFQLNDDKSKKEFFEYLREEIGDIYSFTQYLARTIYDFTNFFKPNKEKELAPLSSPIKKALDVLDSRIIKENIQITLDIQSDRKIELYKYEMMQVIINIISNSIDNFIEKGIKEPKISIKACCEDDQCIVQICDNGGGINEAILPKIFDPYFSTKEEKNGTGLGLYISKVVIEDHSSGLLNVANVDDGVCFEIILKRQNL